MPIARAPFRALPSHPASAKRRPIPHAEPASCLNEAFPVVVRDLGRPHPSAADITGEYTDMAVDFSMRQLLEAGAHFGHQAHRWNPKMQPYIFGTRNNIHIIDLAQTVPAMHQALQAVSDTVAKGGRVLFVGTKRQAADTIAEAAKRSAQYYVNSRWLGGMLTNFKTVKTSIKRLKDMEAAKEAGATDTMSKKEALMFEREMDKLQKSIGGIKDMGGIPDAIFVVDVGYHKIAVTEAAKLGIPVIGVVDTNHSPEGIDYVIPGNDDSSKAVALYVRGVADAILEGRANAVQEVVEAARGGDDFVEVQEG